MTSSVFLLRRPPWVRFATAVACILLSAIVSRRSDCDNDVALVVLVLLPAVGLQVLSAAISFVLSVIAATRSWREALAEFGVGVLMLFAIFLMVVAARLSTPGDCV